LPTPPMLHDRELILVFEQGIERQAAAPEPAPIKRTKLVAPKAIASIAYDHAEALKTRRDKTGAVNVRILPTYVERGGKHWKPYEIIHLAVSVAEPLIAAGEAERLDRGAPAPMAQIAPEPKLEPASFMARAQAAPAAPPPANSAAELPVGADGLVTVMTLRPGLPLPQGGISGLMPSLQKLSPRQAMAWLRNGGATVPTDAELAGLLPPAEIAPAIEIAVGAKVEAAA
jgi:hypothetical protein